MERPVVITTVNRLTAEGHLHLSTEGIMDIIVVGPDHHRHTTEDHLIFLRDLRRITIIVVDPEHHQDMADHVALLITTVVDDPEAHEAMVGLDLHLIMPENHCVEEAHMAAVVITPLLTDHLYYHQMTWSIGK